MFYDKRDGYSNERISWRNLREMMGLSRSRSTTGGVIAILVLVVFILLVGTGYLGIWSNPNQQNLRDLAALLIILLIFIGGVGLFTWSIRRSEQRVQHELKLAEWYAQHERDLEAQRFQETAFQTYLDRMTELLLEKGLRRSKPGDEVRDIARARTLTALRGLDGPHKGILVRFLHESELIKNKGIIDLRGANLRGADLHQAKLNGVDLSGVDLSGADLSEADLRGANLEGAVIIVANLSETDLQGANLSGVNLTEAVMNGANFSGVNLSESDLHGANLEGVNLEKANLGRANLYGAVLIDANLSQADLRQIVLSRTNLSRADLSETNLSEADLSWTNLSWANLGGANLAEANLHGANMDGADVIGSNLSEVKSLKGAKMPDGREHG
jgi:uncharacterized protein YjbI with pentapeptide repeats